MLLKSTALTLCFRETALECGAASHRFSCMVPHCFILFPACRYIPPTSRTKRHRTLACVTTRCRAVNTDQSMNRVRSSLMTSLPKLEEPETPQALSEEPLTAQVLVIVLSSLCQRNGNRLKRAGRQHMLKDQHRTVTAPWDSREEDVWGSARRQTRSLRRLI